MYNSTVGTEDTYDLWKFIDLESYLIDSLDMNVGFLMSSVLKTRMGKRIPKTYSEWDVFIMD